MSNIKEIPVLINCLDQTKWEEIPDEDLWEDGELSPGEVHYKICKNVLEIGNWKLIRESDFTDDEDDGRDREWEEIND